MAKIDELSATMRNLTTDAEQSATKPATAATKVGSIPELLEGIFSHLPVLDLVVATGVNKTFRNVVQASPKLQQKLFMSPSTDETEYWRHIPVDGEDEYIYDETFLYEIVCPGASREAHLASLASDRDDWIYYPPRSLQVALASPLLQVDPWVLDHDKLLSTNAAMTLHPRATKLAGHWTNMYLSNPPCKTVRYNLWWEGRVDGVCDVKFNIFGRFDRDEGVTFASLLDDVTNPRRAIKVWTPITEDHEDYDSTFPGCFDCHEVDQITLHEEIDRWKSLNSKRVVELSERSHISLGLTMVSNEDRFDRLTALGRMMVSAS
jgi:hypothetical protein